VRERDAEHFEKLAGRLHALEFPVLIRPMVPYGAPPTVELIAWAIEVYVFCFLAHIRQLVESYALLLRHMHWPTTFFVGRGLFEVAGHAMLVLRKVRAALKSNDYAAGWDVFAAAIMGNREMLDSGVKTSAGTDWQEPFHVNDDVRALAAVLPGESRKDREAEVLLMYSFLCEFCHPNMGAVTQYCVFDESGDINSMRLRPSPDDRIAMDETRFAVTAGLYAAIELLRLYGRHEALVARVEAAWDEFNDSSCEEN
jgi:hypothetical protein